MFASTCQNDTIFNNSFIKNTVKPVLYYALPRHNMLYATVPVDQDNHPVELPRMLQGDGLDGLLLVGAFVDATIERLMQRDALPTVLVDAYAAENDYDSVISDNFRG